MSAALVSQFTAQEKMAACQREAGYRRYVYPKRVADGKMTKSAADREIALVDEMAADYGALAAKERLL